MGRVVREVAYGPERSDAIYVDEHPVYTSAGVTAGIDLSLYLVERDLGSRVALAVARLLVVFLHRPGGQSQFSASLVARSGTDQRFRDLALAIVRKPRDDYREETMRRAFHRWLGVAPTDDRVRFSSGSAAPRGIMARSF